jgi:hypothetical protein
MVVQFSIDMLSGPIFDQRYLQDSVVIEVSYDVFSAERDFTLWDIAGTLVADQATGSFNTGLRCDRSPRQATPPAVPVPRVALCSRLHYD